MIHELGKDIDVARVRRFDVICAGEALWSAELPAHRPATARFVPGGGAVNAALALADAGVRTGLAITISDDRFGRALVQRLATAQVDIGGVALSATRTGLVFLARIGGARQIVPFRREEEPVTLPEGWSSQVLLLSGLSPVVSHAAALCKAARAARRRGTVVFVDVNVRRLVWEGRDPRVILMLLHEADVVRCSAEDHAALGLDAPALRRALRRDAVLLGNNETGTVWATGPFGEIAREAAAPRTPRPMGAGDVFTALVCAHLARLGHAAEQRPDTWRDLLDRGLAAVRAMPRERSTSSRL